MSLVPTNVNSSGGSSGFQQQGSLDWVSLSRETVGFSVQVLSNLARGGVHPYTVVVSQHLIGKSFELSTAGKKNFEVALRQLKSFSAFSEVLRIGFGIECLPRLLSTTEQGFSFSALCSAIGECYAEEFGCTVLHEMTKLARIPDELTPSLLEWRNMLRVFQGVLSTSQFALVIGQLTKNLSSFASETVSWTSRSPVWHHQMPYEAAAIAKALLSLGRISRGELHSVSIVGGSCGLSWLATFSDWLLGLRTTVTVSSSAGDRIIQSNCATDDVQVRIVYLQRDESTWSEIQTSETVRLSSFEEIIDGSPLHFRTSFGFGRIEWEKCLSTAFGEHFKLLLNLNSLVGGILGSTARILQVIRAEPFQDDFYNSQVSPGTGFPSGGDFIRCLPRIFPELQVFMPAMNNAVAFSYDQAINFLESDLALLCSKCLCHSCSRPQAEPRADEEQHGARTKKYCFPVLIQTIVYMGRLLSRACVSDGLLPVMFGFESIYALVDTSRRRAFPATSGFIISRELMEFIHPLCSSAVADPFDAMFAIFTLSSHRVRTTCAHSAHGLCVFSNSLCEIPDPAANQILLHVVPGRIHYQGRNYGDITTPGGSPRFDDLVSVLNSTWSMSMLVTPQIESLRVHYQAKSLTSTVEIDPVSITNVLSMLIYVDACPGLDCLNKRDAVSAQKAVSGTHVQVKLHGTDISVVSADNKLICLALLSLFSDTKITTPIYPLWRHPSACMDCTLQQAAEIMPLGKVVIFQSSDFAKGYAIRSSEPWISVD